MFKEKGGSSVVDKEICGICDVQYAILVENDVAG